MLTASLAVHRQRGRAQAQEGWNLQCSADEVVERRAERVGLDGWRAERAARESRRLAPSDLRELRGKLETPRLTEAVLGHQLGARLEAVQHRPPPFRLPGSREGLGHASLERHELGA